MIFLSNKELDKIISTQLNMPLLAIDDKGYGGELMYNLQDFIINTCTLNICNIITN